MKPNHIIFLCINSFIVIACSSKKENSHARIIWERHDNGNYRTVHQFFTDTADMTEDYYYQEFYENGNLKIQGLENQRTRKGEWKAYFENGDLKAKLTFENDLLNGPIILYNDEGRVKAQDKAENGDLKLNNNDIKSFLMENFNISENRPNWNDSLDILVDKLKQ